MSNNPLILSYNKNKEIEEYAPASSPSVSSSNSFEKNELIYHSFFLPNQSALTEESLLNNDIMKTNTNLNLYKSFSASPLIFNNDTKNTSNGYNNIYSAKTHQDFEKKDFNNINNNKIKKEKKIDNKINSILQKKPRKKKLLNNYNSYRNIYENQKYKSNTKESKNKPKKIKTISIRKKEEKKDISGNITVKNENVENRVQYDKVNKKINIYIKNNIYNYNLINDVNHNNTNNIIDTSLTKTDIKIPAEEYLIKNDISSKHNNNKKPSIKLAPMDNTNNKNIFLKEKEINMGIINNYNNINNFKFDFPFSQFNNNPQNPIKIYNKNISYKKLLPKLYYIYNKSAHNKNKPIINILSFLNQKEIIEVINTRNKKLMLIINKSLIDSYFFNIKKNLKKYSNFLEIIKSTLIYSYSKQKLNLKIDLMLSIRFIDKKNKISLNPKHFQLLYLFEFLRDKNNSEKKNNKNRLYDCYGFDIIPEIKKSENKSKEEFKGIYLSKQMSRFHIDKNDELINIQPILPFKLNDRGIFNFEIFSNQNYFINPRNLKIKLNILDLYSNPDINELRINEYENICKYWKLKGGVNEKKIEIYKGIIKEWFEKLFFVKDIFYADIGLWVFKLNLVANNCGILDNPNLNVKIIIKEKEDYVENEIKKNNLLFERNNVFEIRKGENIIFFLSMY